MLPYLTAYQDQIKSHSLYIHLQCNFCMYVLWTVNITDGKNDLSKWVFVYASRARLGQKIQRQKLESETKSLAKK